jgi:hypothetical protein
MARKLRGQSVMLGRHANPVLQAYMEAGGSEGGITVEDMPGNNADTVSAFPGDPNGDDEESDIVIDKEGMTDAYARIGDLLEAIDIPVEPLNKDNFLQNLYKGVMRKLKGENMSFAIEDDRAQGVVEELLDSKSAMAGNAKDRHDREQKSNNRKARIARLMREIRKSKLEMVTVQQWSTELVRRDPTLRYPEESWADFAAEVQEVGQRLQIFGGGNSPRQVPPYIEPTGMPMSMTQPGTQNSSCCFEYRQNRNCQAMTATRCDYIAEKVLSAPRCR